MIEFKKILWPTDFSKPSYEALRTADNMALHFGAKLYLVHVVSNIPSLVAPRAPIAFDVPSYQKELDAEAVKKLSKIKKNDLSEKVAAETVVRHGEASLLIVETAEEENIDLIVLATHGLTGWRHLVFGSVAEKVVRNAKCPVLTIRPDQNDGKSGKSK